MKSNPIRRLLFISVFSLLAENCPAAVSPARTVMDFDFDWRFSRGDFPTAAMAAFDDSAWRRVNVPHDWSIEGPFSPEFGSGNGFAPGGLGWYRKHFKLDDAQRGKSVVIEFDGVYDYSEVWINGAYAGGRPYGFSSFHCDLTPGLKFGGADNVIAVRVDHSRFADSRYYTGSGIYRHVRLCVTDQLHLAHDGVYVTTPKIENGGAVVNIETTVQNDSGDEKSFSLESEIFSPDGKIFGSETSHAYDAWTAVRDHEYISGQFLWTGIDYLGEADQWPNRASGPGLLDLCGFKKPLAWFRQSLWSDRPMVYLCAQNSNRGAGGRRGPAGIEQWNWPANSIVTVRCFASCPEVALTLNGKIIGTKNWAEATNGVLSWRIPFEPGVLQAVGRSQGQAVATYELKTAGAASRIELIPDATNLGADGKNICHLEFRIVDAHGVRVPDAEPEVTFEINGPAQLLGIENCDLNSAEPYQGPTRRAFHGRGLAILESTQTAGEATVKVSAPGIQPASFTLKTSAANPL